MTRYLWVAFAFVVLVRPVAAEESNDSRALMKAAPTYLLGFADMPPIWRARVGVGFGHVFAGRLQAEGALSAGIPLGWGADFRLRYIVPAGKGLHLLAGLGPTLNLMGGPFGRSPQHDADIAVDGGHVYRVLTVSPEIGVEFRALAKPSDRLSFVLRATLGFPFVVDHDLQGLCRALATEDSSCYPPHFVSAPVFVETKWWWWYLRYSAGLAW